MFRNDLQIREARPDNDPDELKQVSRILAEGAELMEALGDTRWETDQMELPYLDAIARARQLFVVLRNDEVVGTSKIQPKDPTERAQVCAGSMAAWGFPFTVTKSSIGLRS